jgi:iron-sulfur cluster repair protein YtfE (RIC family)
MKPLETGLRHRLRRAVRQIAAQHLHLRSAHQAVADAAAAGNPGELATCVDRLCGAIDAHFSLEENVFFPALHGLHPQSERDLQALVNDHSAHRSELDRLRALVAGQPSPEFAAAYRAFADETAEHERREERLLAALAHLFDGTD